jgi:hypothetical protein
MKRRALFSAMTVSCLLASTAVDAQRYSAPAYRPPPPPPPSYTPPPRYTPPPASNQNMRQGSQSGSTYQGAQQRSDTTGGNLGGYRPGSIANSNSQGSGKPSGGAPAAGSSARVSGSSAQPGTGGTTKSAGGSTAKQAGGDAFGKGKSTPANDTAKAGAKAGPKTAAQSAGAGAFGAKPAASGNVAQASSTKTPSAVMGNRTVAGANSLDTRKKQQSNEEFCKGANLSSTRCQFNCASLSPRPSYCPPPQGGSQVVKTETPQRVLNPPGPR